MKLSELFESMVCVDYPKNIWKNFEDQISGNSKTYIGQSCHSRTLKAIIQLKKYPNLKVILLGRDDTVTHSIIADDNEIILDAPRIKDSTIDLDSYYINGNKRLDIVSVKTIKDLL